jgi:hypothetical protein
LRAEHKHIPSGFRGIEQGASNGKKGGDLMSSQNQTIVESQEFGKPAHATVAISHTTEKHRSLETVLPLVKAAIDPLGGIARFVHPGDNVLIKPNVTVFYTAEEGCTTDPYVVAALVRLCREAGAAKVQVGESSGGMFNSVQNMRITGIGPAAEREGAELVDLGNCPHAYSPGAKRKGIAPGSAADSAARCHCDH